MTRKIYVYAGWLNNEFIGIIHVLRNNGKENISFEFHEEWLKSHSNILLDPDLFPFSGRQYLNKEKSTFGMLSDVCPDRWGRRLIQRKEEILSLQEKRKPHHLYEMDYLVAVSDFLRTGGLRFKLSPEGNFIAESDGLDIPPITELSRLEQASINYEFSDNPHETKWFSQLISPGSSLGGARPKANIRHTDGSLWIAKFPSKNDDIDLGAWEYIVHELAVLCGLRVPEAMLQKYSSYGSTFIVKRFDRNGLKRIHFASAMTMLGASDGASDQYSYLDIVEFITSYGHNPVKDLEELYRRIVFSIAVSNHDDHLRNHGFLLGTNGWLLSPAYDINPSLDNLEYLSLNITTDNSLSSFDLLISTAKYYQISDNSAHNIVEDIRNTVTKNWHRIAKKIKIPKAQINRMKPCFKTK